MNLTIGQFNESFPPITDGVANVVQNYAYWMQKKYGNCYVITPKHPDAADDYDYKVLRYTSIKVPTRTEYRVGLPKIDPVFWKELKRIPFDIVHAHCPFSSGFAARSIAKKRGIPFVATFHSKYKDDFQASLKSKMIVDNVVSKIVEFYESADEVWAVNEGCADTLREYGYRGGIRIMDNATDFAVRLPSEESNKAVNAMLGISAEVPVFIFVGQHVWQKNVRMIIEAMALLNKRGCLFHMLFVGEGPQKNEMKRLVKALDIKDNVTFAGRISDRDTLANMYLRSSALLFPSLYDMSSLVPKEAAACGCPTVFAKGSDTSQGITDDNGFLIDNTPEALALAVQSIIDQPAKARAVGEEARRTVYKNWESAVDAAYERYERLCYRRTTAVAAVDLSRDF